MNKVILMGRLTRDPDIRYSQGSEQLCTARFTLAVDRRTAKKEGQQQADFVSCIAFGRSAEFAEKYLKKGTKICTEGQIRTGSYTNRDGQKVYTTDVVIESMEFAESKVSGSSQQAAEQPQTSVPQDGGFMNIPDGIDDEGLPFC